MNTEMNNEMTQNETMTSETQTVNQESATVAEQKNETQASATVEKKSKKKATAKKSEKKEEKAEKSENMRHAEIAQFEKLLLYIYKQDARKSVSIAQIKSALAKQIECYRLSVYFWEIGLKANVQLEKVREKRSIVSVKILNRADARTYLSSRNLLKEEKNKQTKSETQASEVASEVIEEKQETVTAQTVARNLLEIASVS